MTKIAVMGSAFNPPSLGHKDVIRQALKQCDEVWLVPSFRHAWGKSMAPYEQRCQMVKAFLNDLNDPRVRLYAIEHEIAGDAPVYSYDLLCALQSRITQSDTLYLLIGPDNAAAFERFHKADEIKKKWQLMVVKERVPMRSTTIRHAIQNQHSIEGMTTPTVVEFLLHTPLYSDEKTS